MWVMVWFLDVVGWAAFRVPGGSVWVYIQGSGKCVCKRVGLFGFCRAAGGLPPPPLSSPTGERNISTIFSAEVHYTNLLKV